MVRRQLQLGIRDSYRYVPGSDVMNDPRYLNLEPCSRRDAYSCDITYGTNHEYGFDYLRDNMAFSEEELVMSELHFAIVYEFEPILLAEARTRLLQKTKTGANEHTKEGHKEAKNDPKRNRERAQQEPQGRHEETMEK